MSWLSKTSSLPHEKRDSLNTSREKPYGNWRVNRKMTPELAMEEEAKFPTMEYLNSGNFGVAYTLDHKVVKYTVDREEYIAALKVLKNPVPCIATIFSAEQLHDLNLYRIVVEKVKTLDHDERKIISYLRDKIKDKDFYFWKDEFKHPIAKQYITMLKCLEAHGYSIGDAHKKNIGYNKKGRLVLFDLGLAL